MQQEAELQWNLAGTQYLEENEEDFKKQMDFLPDKEPIGYPSQGNMLLNDTFCIF